jgi:glucose dehydrogenase
MLDPAKMLQNPTDTWPTYQSDYSGRRYSELKQITSANVHTLSLAWVTRFTAAGNVTVKSTRW